MFQVPKRRSKKTTFFGTYNMNISDLSIGVEKIDLLNNLHPFQEGEGEIVQYIKMVDFSTNQNAAKLEFSIKLT